MVRSTLHHDFNSSIIAELNCYTTPRKVLALVSRARIVIWLLAGQPGA